MRWSFYHRRLDEIAVRASPVYLNAVPAVEKGAAVGAVMVDIGKDLLHVGLRDDGSEICRLIERITDRHLESTSDEIVLKSLIDRSLDKNARSAQADLTLIREGRTHRCLERLIVIAIGEN